MPAVYEAPFSGQADALRRVRRTILPPGFPQRAYIAMNLPEDRAGKQRTYEALLPGWRFVGEGAGRIVFLEPRLAYVIKLAKHAVGARDNLVEAETYRRASPGMLRVLAQVTAAAPDGLWLEMPYGAEGIGGGVEFDHANNAAFAAGLRCLDLKPDSYRRFPSLNNEVRLVDFGQGGCLNGTLWSDDYSPAVTTTGTPSGEADLRNFVAALYDAGLREALRRAAVSGSKQDAQTAAAALDALTMRLRAAHAAEGPNSVMGQLAARTSAVKAFVDAQSNPPFFDADKARRGYAKDAQHILDVLNQYAVTQARLSAPTV